MSGTESPATSLETPQSQNQGSGPGATRRSHPKSRSGCRTCKRRKIKCDESRPACKNCAKHAVTCDFEVELRPPPRVPNKSASEGLNMLDLELLHNWSTSTAGTVSSDPIVAVLWRVTVPRIAFTCDFLMYAILAISAMQIAHFLPRGRRESYLSKAYEYHQLASRQAMELMQGQVTEELAEKLLLFSCITFCFCFAVGPPKKGEGILYIGDSSVPDWIRLLEGSASLINMMGSRRDTGPVSPLFISGAQRILAMDRNAADRAAQPLDPTRSVQVRSLEALDALQTRIDQELNFRPVEEAASTAAARQAYSSAIRELATSLLSALDEPQSSDIGHAFIWVFKVSRDFMPLLRVPEQEAVAVFAHFCVLLRRFEGSWWLAGWADHLIEKAYAMLDETHRLWIRWPIEELGYVPPPP